MSSVTLLIPVASLAILDGQLFGLPVLHWLVSFIIPLLLLAGWLIYSLLLTGTRRQVLPDLVTLSNEIERFQAFDIELLPDIADLFRHCASPELSEAFARLYRDHEVLYQQRWLPDPAREFRLDQLFSGLRRSSLSYQPAISLFSSGLFAALIALLLRVLLPVEQADLAAFLPWPPLIVGLATAALLAGQVRTTAALIRGELHKLCLSLSRHVPVFSEQSGLALLIDTFHAHDQRLEQILARFTETTDKLANAELVAGFRQSVELVLGETVNPLLRQSTETLHQLATGITERQDQGMAELADKFSRTMTTEITTQMAPAHAEISRMAALMTDVKNYVEYALGAMEAVHRESAAMLADTQTSLRQMNLVSVQLSEGFAKAGDNIADLGQISERISQLYSGQAFSLNDSLANLASQLQNQQTILAQTVTQATQILDNGRQIAVEQQEAANQYLTTLQDQVMLLGNGLQSRLGELLAAVRSETREVAAQASQLHGQSLELNQLLEKAMAQFTQQTAQYVGHTLQQFDQGLAEVVERLAFTTTEIRDAVEALPAVLRQGPQYH